LAGVLRQFNSKVVVLPNMLPREHWDVERTDNGDTVVVGWAGSVSRSWDLRVVSTVMPYLLGRYPNLEFHVSGPSNIEAFPEHERIRLLGPVSIEQYPTLLAPFDIGLAPLDDNEFNRAKSDLKFLEYARLGIPCVASKLEPYIHSIVPGVNGFLAKRERDWLKHLTALIEDAELRASIGAAAKDFAMTRIIDDHIGLWEKAYGLT
jgi:glycosyltransferase involved in cell wall biosynthesis